jgi:hypothetical protein
MCRYLELWNGHLPWNVGMPQNVNIGNSETALQLTPETALQLTPYLHRKLPCN